MMDKQSATFEGLKSTLRDNFNRVLEDFGTILLPYLKSGVEVCDTSSRSFKGICPNAFWQVCFSGNYRAGLAFVCRRWRSNTNEPYEFRSSQSSRWFCGDGANRNCHGFCQWRTLCRADGGGSCCLGSPGPVTPLHCRRSGIGRNCIWVECEFSGMGQSDGGFSYDHNRLCGHSARIGSVLWGVKQIWDSWNGETFDLGGMEAQLQSIGMLENLKNLGTWVVRFKEFFSSAFERIGEVLQGTYNTIIEPIFGGLGRIFDRIWEVVKKVFPEVNKAFGEMTAWQAAGRGLGEVFNVLLIPLKTHRTVYFVYGKRYNHAR